MCTLQRITKLDFQLYWQSTQPETQTQPPCPLKVSRWHYKKKKKSFFLLRLRCFLLSLEPIQSFLLLLAGTMDSLNGQSNHILKVIQMENIINPKRNTFLLIQKYSFLSLSRVKHKFFCCHL